MLNEMLGINPLKSAIFDRKWFGGVVLEIEKRIVDETKCAWLGGKPPFVRELLGVGVKSGGL